MMPRGDSQALSESKEDGFGITIVSTGSSCYGLVPDVPVRILPEIEKDVLQIYYYGSSGY